MRVLLTYLFIVLTWSLSSQEDPNNILTAITKDIHNGSVKTLAERLDPSVSYIIKAGQFWCSPCRRSVTKLRAKQAILKAKYNVELIILEQENWHNSEFVVRGQEEYDWNFPMYSVDQKFRFFDIIGIPTYFFIPAGATQHIEKRRGGISDYESYVRRSLGITDRLGAIGESFEQVVTADCEETLIVKPTEEVIEFEGSNYYRVGELYLGETTSTNLVLRYDPDKEEAFLYLDYNLHLCNTRWLVDQEGDSLQVRVIDSYEIDDRRYYVTDKFIANECNQSFPLEIIEGLGTNGGLLFDIEGDQVVTRMICHTGPAGLEYIDQFSELGCVAATVHESESAQTYTLFPNPTQDVISIASYSGGRHEVELLNMHGQKLISCDFYGTEFSLDISELELGYYVVKVLHQGQVSYLPVIKS